MRVLGILSIRDRVVQGALKLILEPIFEADFQEGSYGYRPKRTAHEVVHRVAKAVMEHKYRVIDVDLKAYFDNVRHDILLRQVAERVNDAEVMRLLKLIPKASGKRGVPPGGVISPLLANLYLNGVDRMLERAKEVTRRGPYFHVEYARFADRRTEGRVLWLPGLQVSPGADAAGEAGAAVHAEDEGADGAPAEGSRTSSASTFPSRGGGDRDGQPHPARLGELLPGRTFLAVLFLAGVPAIG